MAKFAFVVPPLTGHVNPTVSVGRELLARRHRVTWIGHPSRVQALLPQGAELHALDDPVDEQALDEIAERAKNLRGPAALKFLTADFFVPLARLMRPAVDAAVAAIEPDAIITDQQTLAGALVARARNLPWATSASTSAAVVEPLADLPKVKAWRDGLYAELEREAGLEPVPQPDMSPDLVLVFSTAALIGPAACDLPNHYALVGPAMNDRPQSTEFPWKALADKPRLLVSLGTVNAPAGERFFRAVIDAFAKEPVQVIMVAPSEPFGPVPDDFIRCDYVPQLALLPHLSAVISHAGHNTVVETLAHGHPLIVAPIRDDQTIVAQQVADAGAGIRVRFARVRAEGLRTAAHKVLHDPAYRAAAERIRDSFATAGGAARSADLLERLVSR